MSLAFALFLFLLVTIQQCFAAPTSGYDRSPPRCRTNVTIPSYPENCVNSCRLVQNLQLRCGDTIPCMCHYAPPTSVSECIQCVTEAAGDLTRVMDGYMQATREVQSYVSACEALSIPADGGPPTTEVYDPYCPTSILVDIPAGAQLYITPLHSFLPYLSFSAAVVLLAVARRWH